MSAPGDKPGLSIVGDDTAGAPDSPGTQSRQAAQRDEGRGGSFWLILAALVVVSIWGLMTSQRAGRLEAEVEHLTFELAAASAELDAHRVHLDRVRSGVEDLKGQVEALSALTQAAPGTTGATGPPDDAAPPAAP